jgi:hypothetical protein
MKQTKFSNQDNRSALRMYLRAREDFQAMRKRMDNRLGIKADGTQQKIQDVRSFALEDIENFKLISENARQQEKQTEKMLKKVLLRFPIYNEWLKEVKGVGEIAAGWIISSFDIEKATTVSKMWQYAGLNPGMVKGKKRVSKKEYKPIMGTIITEVPNIKNDGNDYIIETNDMIRGDRATEGYVLPYNKNLRTHLVGVMGAGFIKAQNSYALEFYYPYKLRLENEDSIVINEGKARKGDGKPWKEVSKGHRNNAAIRYMVKMFIKDLYAAWREIEGLPVRVPYAEEYLGKKHAS